MACSPRPEKVQEWSARLARLAASGMSLAQFYQQEGVSEASLYY